jgi:hypothetical protein
VRRPRTNPARRLAAALVLTLSGLAACAAPRPPAATAAPATPATEPAARHPAAPHVVAFGDVHGDLEAARHALRLAGAIDAADRWIGGSLVVVQTGDQLDRGDHERAILHLFDRLAEEAAASGGAFHALNGNHEVMNAQLDLRYVTEGGFRDFEGAAELPAEMDSVLAAHPPEHRARVAAFRPGGPYARLLARRNSIMVVGDNVFVHAGVLPAHAEYGIERINAEIRDWLRGEAERPPWVRGADTPVWTRLYSREVGDEACATVAEVLRLLGARRMIVGHTVHLQGITSYCDGRIWAVDVGMGSYYGGPTEVLEIRGDELRPLRFPQP